MAKLRSAPPPLELGRVLGDRFRVNEVLGEGGTGIVYEAERLSDGKSVALKVMHPHLAGDKQIRGRFTREAAILRRLSGTHICPILEFGELEDPRGPDRGLLYLVLPRLEGRSLDRVLAEETLPLSQVFRVAQHVCDALDEAHAQGVIHRDLKPGNVLLEPSGHVHVVDFGMAKILAGSGTGTTGLTQQNMVFGTPEYMSPEQARGDELDARCDVYAAGVLLYEMLTGQVPFQGHGTIPVLTAHLTETPLRPSERAPERNISRALDAVVMSALAKDPAARYPTARSLGRALLRAREAPHDEHGVCPSTRVPISQAVDSHAQTIPAPEPAPKTTVPVPGERRPSLWLTPWVLVWGLAVLLGIVLGVLLSLRRVL